MQRRHSAVVSSLAFPSPQRCVGVQFTRAPESQFWMFSKLFCDFLLAARKWQWRGGGVFIPQKLANAANQSLSFLLCVAKCLPARCLTLLPSHFPLTHCSSRLCLCLPVCGLQWAQHSKVHEGELECGLCYNPSGSHTSFFLQVPVCPWQTPGWYEEMWKTWITTV